jgi:hypothetical protein
MCRVETLEKQHPVCTEDKIAQNVKGGVGLQNQRLGWDMGFIISYIKRMDGSGTATRPFVARP